MQKPVVVLSVVTKNQNPSWGAVYGNPEIRDSKSPDSIGIYIPEQLILAHQLKGVF
jgi:hypothetical protein